MYDWAFNHATENGHLHVVEYLIEQGCDAKKINQKKLNSKLINACRFGKLGEVMRLVESGADVHVGNDEGGQSQERNARL
jgi:ankyrin repeat protein